MINQDEINYFFDYPNNNIFICKEFELKPKNIGKYICAISNTATGYIVIGATYLEEKFNFNGISNNFKFENIINESKKFLSNPPKVTFQLIRKFNVNLLFIKVEKSEKIIKFNKEIYKIEDRDIVKLEGEKIMDKTKVFIVHGHDNEVKQETARFIEKLGLEAIILHEKASGSKTIIEKIEAYSNVGFGIVLYTPCDEGKAIGDITLKQRARQNVIFEHGYLIGKIGRENVCALVKGEIEKPNDISGIVYISLDIGNWKTDLVKELKNVGYKVDLEALLK